MTANPRIGELLVNKGLVTGDQVRIALLEQKGSGARLGSVLVALGFLSEAALRDALGEAFDQSSIHLSTVLPDAAAIARVPLALARRFHVAPVSWDEPAQVLAVAMQDTFNVVVTDQLSAHLGGRVQIRPLLAGEAEIARAIDRFYGVELSIDGTLHELETGQTEPDSPAVGEAGHRHPVVRLVNALIADAVKRRASDIHFEPEYRFLRIRYRIDGVLRQVRSVHAKYWPAMAVRLKVMAALNIAESRAPQDGRLSLSLFGRAIDVRVSSLPTIHGENIVLRILDRQHGVLPMAELGLSPANLETLQLLMARPEGIILVTGPTGSGKTTTLYSLLNAINTEQVNIMTLEDPVEYPIAGVRQSMANDAARLDFANGIRAIMRQDPDVILVGEIRDPETAHMALRAAMTGHQVYSTLHSNSAIGAVPRLFDLGLKGEILAGNIIGVVAQRLVRRLCPHCRQSRAATARERRLLGDTSETTPLLWNPVGCPRCDHQGFHGRIALMEVLRFDEELDELVARHATGKELKTAAERRAFRCMADDGIQRARAGATSLDEVARVVDLTGLIH